MTTTDHAQEAQVVLDKIAKKSGGNFSIDQALALVSAHATLAVAHELRTANLIAVVEQAAHTIDVTAWPMSRVDRLNAAQHEIATRLGLDGGADS